MFDFEKLKLLKESNKLEVKKAQGGLPRSLWETYSAFANTDGGTILLGISEENEELKIVGVKNLDNLIKDFWSTINSDKVSLNILSENNLIIHDINGLNIIEITIPRAKRYKKPIYLSKNIFGGTYIRTNEGDFKLSQRGVKSLLRDQACETMDSLLLEDFLTDDLNKESLRSFRSMHSAHNPTHPFLKLDIDNYLTRIGAAVFSNKDNQYHPTIAGMLMFGDEWNIVRKFPKYFVEYVEYEDFPISWNERIISQSGEWSGNLFDFFSYCLKQSL